MSQEKQHYNKKNSGLKLFPKDCLGQSGTIVSIDLSNNDISVLPKEMGVFKGLTHFRMMANKINALPLSFATLTGIRHLDLNANQFTTFPTQISTLTGLEELQMIQNQMTEIPECIGNLTKLQRISFTANFLKTLPVSLAKCTDMNYIELTSNEFEKFPEVVCQLSKVTILMLQQNQLKDVPSSISKLERMSGLYLSTNNFDKFPETICKCPSLTQLEIDNNNFVDIPDSLSLLTKLKTLIINKSFVSCLNTIDAMSSLCQIVMSDTKCMFLPDLSTNSKLTSLIVIRGCLNEVKSLPPNCSCRFGGNSIESIEFPENGVVQYMILANNKLTCSPDLSMLSKISRLDLSQNRITWFDDKTCHPTLQQLDVSCNPLVEFPVCLSRCVSLKTLNVSDCHLFDIPTNVLASLSNLENLYLACNHLSSLESLSVSTKLKTLYLQSNNLLHFPRCVCNLTTLKTLFLSNNLITVIPDQISKLSQLEILDLCCNCILDIECLTALYNLKELNVAFNFIKTIPVGFSQMKSLSAMNINGNQLSLKEKIPHLEKKFDFFQVQIPVLKTPKDEVDGATTILSTTVFADKKVVKTFNMPSETYQFLTLKTANGVLSEDEHPIEVGSSEMKGRRPSMQDTTFEIKNFMMKGFHMIGLFDGHGGDNVSKMASAMFPTVFANQLQAQVKRSLSKKKIEPENYIDNWVKTAFSETYEILNKNVENQKYTDGSAAVVVLITPQKLYCANCGDSRALLVQKNTEIPMSVDHKPTHPNELRRIRKNNGYVDKSGRLNGEVGLARALGDLRCHPALTAEPEVLTYNRSGEDLAIVMACDGVWDVFENVTVARMVRERLSMPRVADIACFLRDAAHFNDSGDNISSIVVRL
ncbi:podocan precursor, putative [Entamoeba invadens IP1]|uniref:Podocan, putative n=1 Tax=Entamoeba invadens IP1 TaxID=370355 RepID=A0A0A1TUS5_ENTIV|nr:podocan precursor, putative [Entamoeba invadens IP1]ELP83824.1 podocan precursor, putative [Entamoeba invadens IP1]|eukprot:XP_004183170.1 podocan precursor, putative [Entamoeba invadens IP1]